MTPTAVEFFSPDFTPSEAEEAAFFNALKMRNGTFKTTRAHRFDDVDRELVSLLTERLGPEPEILDVGASSGVSSVELREAMEAAGAAPSVTATDLFVEARIVDLRPGVRVLIDETGWALQYEAFGIPLRPWVRRLDYATLAALPRLAARRTLRDRLRRLAAARAGRLVTLVARRFSESSRMRIVRDDVLEPRADFAGRFDFVRAANILHKDYFDEAQLRRGIANVTGYLRGRGALLLVCRTATRTGENDATLFELDEHRRHTVVARFGAGSELENLVQAHDPSDSGAARS